MKSDEIYCPGGENSQSGVAALEKYNPTKVINSGETIHDIRPKLNEIPGPHVVPIWNSHQGSIKAAEFIWDLIEEANLKIYDMWAKKIEFWHIQRKNNNSEFGVLGSVIVAETQCSNYLKASGKGFKDYSLTTAAFDGYKNGDQVDGVLIAPQENLDEEFEVQSKETANSNNFTTFINFIARDKLICKQDICLTAVMIRPLEVDLGEDEQSLFESLFSYVENISEIPKLTFVINRTEKVGLLFEGKKLTAGDLLDSEQISKNEIKIYETVGNLANEYSKELNNFFDGVFPILNDGDFILHEGQKTCMFACPVLGIYTHGYDTNIVEPVIRFYISQFFKAIDEGVGCTLEQKEFFNKYENEWVEKKSGFIEFKKIQ